MRIALYRNQFDPFTTYDQKVISEIAKLWDISSFVLMPTRKEINSSPDLARIRMCQLGTISNTKTRYLVSDFALKELPNQPPFSALEYLNHQYHGADLFLVLTYEQLLNLEDHFRTGETKSIAQIICVIHSPEQKQRYSFLTGHEVIYYLVPQPTKTKEAIIAHPESEDLAAAVLTYINQNGLYAKQRLKMMFEADQKRFNHSLRVAKTAIKIARCWKNEKLSTKLVKQAYVAGIYHDIAKKISFPEQVKIAKENLKIVNWPHVKVLHGPVGAWWIKEHYLINDPEILQAIAEHTVPQKRDTQLLSKIIFLADHLEPSRMKELGEAVFKYYWKLILNGEVEDCFDQFFDRYQQLFPLACNYWYPIRF